MNRITPKDRHNKLIIPIQQAIKNANKNRPNLRNSKKHTLVDIIILLQQTSQQSGGFSDNLIELVRQWNCYDDSLERQSNETLAWILIHCV